jgi:NADPH-dependent 2,4-dienoyl-CoA reductase/sulfur reductase-like enzyme/rhodanese-related sulfurtransferase
MSEESRREIVIVGASAAGLRCACRLKRLRPEWTVTVVEERQLFSVAACGLPYVLSGDIAELTALRRTGDGALRDAGFFEAVKGVEVLWGWRAVEIDVSARRLRLAGQSGQRVIAWDELVLATGARPRRLPGQPVDPRVQTFHTGDDLTPLHGALARGQIEQVVIVGTGLLGCELSEAFRALWGAEVTLVEAAAAPLPALLDSEAAAIVHQALAANGVALRLGAPVERIEAREDRVLVLAGGEEIAGDRVVVAIGVEPNVDLARQAGVALGATGAIAVDDRLATSVPHVWAAGDCVEIRQAVTGRPGYLPQGSLANRQGRVLADVLAGREERFPPVVGATALKVFDCHVAAAGLTRRAAGEAGLEARVVWISAHDRADYWPETKEIAVALTYEAGSGRVLGVQVVGEGEVTKRVDVAAQWLARGATLRDLAGLEHAYSPPFAPALDPLAVAAMVALDQEDGIEAAPPLSSLDGQRLLDVRHPEEREARPVAGATPMAIPLESLRERVAEVGEGPWLVVCERGARSAEAMRILRAHGRTARYLGGGLRWRTLAGR